MKRVAWALVAALSLAVASLPGTARAFSYTNVGPGYSFSISSAIDLEQPGSSTNITGIGINVTAPLKLMDFQVVDDNYAGYPQLSLELGVNSCNGGSCVGPGTSLYDSGAGGFGGLAAPTLLLAPGKYWLWTWLTLSTASGAFDGATLSGNFVAAPAVAATPIPPALLMFGTAFAGLGGLALRRRGAAM